MYTTQNETVNSFSSFEALLSEYIVPTRSEQRGLAENGANSGYALLTYYNDVQAVYDRFENEIFDVVEEVGGGESVPDMFAAYCKRKQTRCEGTVGDYMHFLVYVAAETICARLADT